MVYRLPGAFPTNPFPHDVNGSLWTLPIELRLYVGAPARRRGGPPRAQRLVARDRARAGRGLRGAARAGFRCAHDDRVVRELALLFGLGSLAYVWRDAVPVSLVAAAIVIVAVAWNPGGYARGALFAPLLAYVVLVAAYHPRLQWPPFNRAGDYSYGLYVYSFPLQQTLMQRLPAARARPACSRSRCRSASRVAAVSWHALERPALALKSRFDVRRGIAMTASPTLREISCADDYDPNSMPVDRARALIRQFLTPVTATERVHVRAALNRVLAEDVVSPIAVPGHDNSAMDGWAVRFADLAPDRETELTRVGDSFAGKPHARRDRARRDRAHLHRRRDAARRGYRRDAGTRHRDRGRRAHRAGRGHQGRPEPPLRRARI